ncbi:MAG TPA: class I SAM-dependent methyltransferase [Flavobacterium sp.]|nr:class I SAM-dependent methyltransferase [Flavobacterium sp.]HAT75372.1 class I SAM-dependent methyltransferase [Flavobacterium sp.]
MKHLDLGCGANPRNPFNAEFLYGVDIRNRLNSSDSSKFTYKSANLTLEKIPFEDNFFDSISAYDFLEHIPRLICNEGKVVFPFVDLMTEIFRVLKPEGQFYAITPVFPKESVFVDPTHVNFISKNSHKYFVSPHNWASMYGFNGSFRVIRVEVVNFSYEEDNSSSFKKFLKKILINFISNSKQHIVWHFSAIK